MSVVHVESGVFYAYIDGVLTTIPIGAGSPGPTGPAGPTGPTGASGGGAPVWGGITGTLSDQTDLDTALNVNIVDGRLSVNVPLKNANNIFTGINQLGPLTRLAGTTSSFPAIRRNGNVLEIILANETAYAGVNVAHVNLVNGAIVFPAAQAPSSNVNTLDDYKEGDWTPTLTFGEGGVQGIVYNAQAGSYTKVGRKVTLCGMINLQDKGSSVGQARITGMPFIVPVATKFYASASCYFGNFIAGISNITMLTTPNNTILTLWKVNSYLYNTDFTNFSILVFGITYFTD